MNGAVPVTATPNFTTLPTSAITDEGCIAIVGGNTTVTVAAVDTNVRPIPLTSTVKLPPSLNATGRYVYVGPVAPGITTPLFFHTYVNVPLPRASTDNVASVPLNTVTSSGPRTNSDKPNGLNTGSFDPFPNCPYALSPHAHSEPSAFTPTE